MTKRVAPLLALVVVLSWAAPAAAQRLSGSIVPEHYTLWFAPDLEKETFRGRETIRVQIKVPTSAVTLHAAEIQFGDVTIAAGGTTQSARVTLNETDETATLTVPQPLAAGPATIAIAYTGILNDKLRGFYVSRANGRKYAVTQMEATDARRAFPSFDEPIYKATFEISLMVDEGDTAISNGAQVSDTPGPEPGKHTLVFAPTARMSTYLVAMLVGDFTCRSGGSVEGAPIRVCATPDKLPLTGFALEAAAQQLRFYNAYFGIPYPFGKLDFVAVPDFAAGAMENTGAITFRERLLLVDPERASLSVRKSVASILSHEIAHQWFGNLVTMKWWDDIWLNEGFATWMENKAVAEWRPEWNVELDEAAATSGALGLDALRSTRPIRFEVETPEQINEVFDGIAYEKSAAVLRMVEAFVGPDPFRKAVASYLKKYAYANAAGDDFWTEVARVTGRPVDRIMKSYVDQAGAPVLSVRTTCTGERTDIALTQRRFIGAATESAPAAEPWVIPVCFTADAGNARCEVFDGRQQTLSVPGCSTIFANADSRGYYFTEYSPDAIGTLARRASTLDPVERIGLVGDEWWMVRSGRHDIGVFLDLAAAFANDETPAVTDAIAQRLSTTGQYIVAPARQARYQAWIRERFGPALARMGLPGDDDDSDMRQSRRADLLLLVAASGNDMAVQRRARELALAYLGDPTSVPGTLAPAVLRVAALSNDAALYDRYRARLEQLGAEPEEYYRFFNALTWFRDPALVKRTLEFAISPAVRTQDASTLIAGLLAASSSDDLAWNFVRANWAALVKRLDPFQGIPTIAAGLGGFCSAEKAAEVKRFFADNPVPFAERAITQALERIENCAAMVARQSAALTRWLDSSSLIPPH